MAPPVPDLRRWRAVRAPGGSGIVDHGAGLDIGPKLRDSVLSTEGSELAGFRDEDPGAARYTAQ